MYNGYMSAFQSLRDRLDNSPSARAARKHWLTLSFLGGFITDLILLNKVDDLLDNIILLFYVSLSMLAMLLLYAGLAERFSETWSRRAQTYAPLLIQYAFGGLLSGMLILYGRSGSIVSSWPFFIIFLLVIYGNETIRQRGRRLVFNLSLFFIGLFPYVVLVSSVFSGFSGPWLFVLSGLAALLIMYFFVRTLYRIVPRFLRLNLRAVIVSIGGIYLLFNTLYFLNIIPPMPLSLKEAGVYHSVIRYENGDYELRYVPESSWKFWRQSDKVFYPSEGGNVFCFAKITNPTQLEMTIVHSWEYKAADGRWVERSKIPYPITTSKREGGYRGYTQIGNYEPGRWRCSIENERGQILGRVNFTIAPQGSPPRELEVRVDGN